MKPPAKPPSKSPITAGRRLQPDERALWNRVAQTVTPLPKRAPTVGAIQPALAPPPKASPLQPRRIESMTPEEWTIGSALTGGKSRSASGLVSTSRAQAQIQANRLAPGGATLDGGWDKGFRRGAIRPDRSIDLHGYTVDQAHALLERAIAAALADDVRVLLVVTGKEPKGQPRHDPAYHQPAYLPDAPRRRGIIRASIADWLAHSRHAPMIAAVRNAHPRDGGAGALYVVLRRKR
ncbi:DNA mismatch repair protein MutS [Pseudonocardia sp. TMWB2A]